MKKVTKVAVLLFAMTMLVSVLAACGNSSNASGGASQAAGQGSEAQAPAAGGELKFGTNAEFPPFEFVAANGVIGQYDGIDMAIAKQIAEENGKTAVIENMEFDSLLVALQNGQIDAVIAGMTVTDERKESVDFSTPYYTATQVMIVKEDSDITKASDIADKKICVIQGYTGQTCMDEMGYPYEAFKKGTEAVLELVNGKCDVVVIDSATAAKYVSDNKGLKIVEDPTAFEGEEYAIAVQKGNTELLNMVNAAIEKKLADGTISSLAAQYAEMDAE
ncbi:MAG: transporter substrate-binding domain-containing protein [Lachnospiraceae bacterium]|nr:transporter substrate-binding domain-containing protein [Lachnospiraceae bacterium]